MDLIPVLADAVGPDDWLFVDRIHFTDDGDDLVARLLAASFDLAGPPRPARPAAGSRRWTAKSSSRRMARVPGP